MRRVCGNHAVLRRLCRGIPLFPRHGAAETGRRRDQVGQMDGEPTAKEFRAATGAFVGNISVITVGDGDEASGLIVTSVVAPSNDPPLLLACINRSASSHPLLVKHAASAGHRWRRASGGGGTLLGLRRGQGLARYDGAEWETAVTGARLLKGAPVAFDCTVEEMIDRDAWSILTGRVRAIRTTAGAGGLSGGTAATARFRRSSRRCGSRRPAPCPLHPSAPPRATAHQSAASSRVAMRRVAATTRSNLECRARGSE